MAASFTVHLQMLITLLFILQPILMTLVSKWFLEYILINYTMFKIAVPYMNHMYHVELKDIEVNDS